MLISYECNAPSIIGGQVFIDWNCEVGRHSWTSLLLPFEGIHHANLDIFVYEWTV